MGEEEEKGERRAKVRRGMTREIRGCGYGRGGVAVRRPGCGGRRGAAVTVAGAGGRGRGGLPLHRAEDQLRGAARAGVERPQTRHILIPLEAENLFEKSLHNGPRLATSIAVG